MVRINTAHGPCRVQKAALYFFVSSTWALSDLVLGLFFVAWLLAFAVEEEDFGHSLVVGPTPLQKRQRLLVNWQDHSAGISLLFFLILSFRSDIFLSEFWDDKLELHGANGFLCILFWLFWLFWLKEEEDWLCGFSIFSLKTVQHVCIEFPHLIPSIGHQFVGPKFGVWGVWQVYWLVTLLLWCRQEVHNRIGEGVCSYPSL